MAVFYHPILGGEPTTLPKCCGRAFDRPIVGQETFFWLWISISFCSFLLGKIVLAVWWRFLKVPQPSLLIESSQGQDKCLLSEIVAAALHHTMSAKIPRRSRNKNYHSKKRNSNSNNNNNKNNNNNNNNKNNNNNNINNNNSNNNNNNLSLTRRQRKNKDHTDRQKHRQAYRQR